MTVYLLFMASPGILYVLVELLTGQHINRNERVKKVYLTLAGIVTTLMIGLRSPYNGSGDTMFYFEYWESLSDATYEIFRLYLESMDMEGGYQVVTWILSHIFKDGQWLLFLSGAFMSFSVCRFVNRNCKNPMFALMAFNCLGLFNFMVQGLRQAIAMCICLWAIEYCKKGQLLKFLGTVGAACLFHASAIVFTVVYILRYAKLNIKSMMLFAAGTGIGILLLPVLVHLVNILMNDNYVLGHGADEGGIFAILIYLAIILFGMLFADKKDKHYPLFVYMSMIGMTCMILRRSSNEIVERVSLYFAFSQMAVISNSLQSVTKRNNRLMINTVVFGLCFAVAVYKASYSILIPYLFFWQ